jgi:hypothetical protein
LTKAKVEGNGKEQGEMPSKEKIMKPLKQSPFGNEAAIRSQHPAHQLSRQLQFLAQPTNWGKVHLGFEPIFSSTSCCIFSVNNTVFMTPPIITEGGVSRFFTITMNEL